MNNNIMKKLRKYILFIVFFLLISIPNLIKSSQGKQALFGGWDDINSMYPTCVYVKKMVSDIASNRKFTIPMVGYTLGMGEDVFGVLNWLGWGDPFNLVFAFIDDVYLPYAFSAIFYFKLLLGGIAFILMCSEVDDAKTDEAYILGALVYSFTGFTIQCNMFIIFAHAMYCIPLMIYAAERRIKKDKKGILLLSTCLFALSGYYFLYIGSITLAIFTIYRLGQQGKSLKNNLKIIGKLIVEFILGLGLSSVFLIPSLYSFLNSNRVSSVSPANTFFSKQLFINLFRNIFIPQYNSSFQVLSLVSIGVIAIVILFTSNSYWKQKRNLFILVILTTMPIINWIMSGFGEAYDRWEIVVLLYVAFLTIQIWDDFFELSIFQKTAVTILLVLLVYIGKKGKSEELIDNRRYYITIVSYATIWFALMFIIPVVKKVRCGNKYRLCNIILLFVCSYSIYISWAETYLDKPVEYAQPRDVVTELLSEEDGFFRIDNAVTYLAPGNYPNIAFIQDYNGIASYFSTQNSNFTNAMKRWNVSPQITDKIVYRGLDNRAVLETLCGVKYLIYPKDELVTVPYGFDLKTTTDDGMWLLYENSEYLPIIYGYTSVTDSVDNLDGFSIQAYISQAACLESYDGKIKKSDINSIDNKFEIRNIFMQQQVYAGDELTFEIQLLPECENYILISHLDVKNKFEIYENDNLITAASVTPEYNNGYVGFNLGFVENSITKKYTIKVMEDDKISVQIINYDYSDYHELISDLEIDISELKVETNRISAQVDMKEPRMLCVAMPYSSGWTALLDGKKVTTYCINDMFIGLEIDEGIHDLVLVYCTPGIRIGLVIMIISMIGSVLLIRSNKINRVLE